MKKFIEYYYDCEVDKISHNSYGYDVVINNKKYIFKLIEDLTSLEIYKKNMNYLKQYEFFFIIIPNKLNSLYTSINNKNYILLSLKNINNCKISMYDIKTNLYLNEDRIIENYGNLWIKRWEQKIDYLELWINERKTINDKWYSIFQFYIGLGELGILYLKNSIKSIIPNEYDKATIQHNRMHIDSDLYDYYDPTNIIIDHNSRDISEYIKSAIILDINVDDFISALSDYLDIHKFSKFGVSLLYSRIIFPTYFFDYLEKIVGTDKFDELNVIYLEKIAKIYEKRIKKLNILFKKKYNLEVINTI